MAVRCPATWVHAGMSWLHQGGPFFSVFELILVRELGGGCRPALWVVAGRRASPRRTRAAAAAAARRLRSASYCVLASEAVCRCAAVPPPTSTSSRCCPLILRSPLLNPSPTHPPQAANYLNIKSLLDLTCLTVANMIKARPLRLAVQCCCWSVSVAAGGKRDAAFRRLASAPWRARQRPACPSAHVRMHGCLPPLHPRAGQDARGDPQDVQHRERLHARGGAPGCILGGPAHVCTRGMAIAAAAGCAGRVLVPSGGGTGQRPAASLQCSCRPSLSPPEPLRLRRRRRCGGRTSGRSSRAAPPPCSVTQPPPIDASSAAAPRPPRQTSGAAQPAANARPYMSHVHCPPRRLPSAFLVPFAAFVFAALVSTPFLMHCGDGTAPQLT